MSQVSDELTFDLHSSEAARLTDLCSLASDLDDALEFCAHLRRSASLLGRQAGTDEPSADTAVVLDALWTSALMSYRRCFASGRHAMLPGRSRSRIDDVIQALGSEHKELHRMVLSHADRTVAHQVDSHVSTRLSVALSNTGIRRILDVRAMTVSKGPGLSDCLGGHSDESDFGSQYEALEALITEVRVLLEASIEEEHRTLIMALERQLDWCYSEAALQASLAHRPGG